MVKNIRTRAAIGMFFAAQLIISLDRLPSEKIPAASGINNFLRITGGSSATLLAATYWDRRGAFYQSHLVGLLTGFDPALGNTLVQLYQQGLKDQSATAVVIHQVIGQEYLMPRLDIFYFSGWLVLLLIPLGWIVHKPAGGAVAAAAE